MKSSNFEDKLSNSQKILNKLLNPDITLSESMKLYKDGLKELKEADDMLQNAKMEFIELNKNHSNDNDDNL